MQISDTLLQPTRMTEKIKSLKIAAADCPRKVFALNKMHNPTALYPNRKYNSQNRNTL